MVSLSGCLHIKRGQAVFIKVSVLEHYALDELTFSVLHHLLFLAIIIGISASISCLKVPSYHYFVLNSNKMFACFLGN